MYKLNLKDIKIEYGMSGKKKFILNVPSLTVEKGEFFSIVGQSGCGKTTLLKVIAGLLESSKGNIKIDGNLVTGVPADKRGIGMVFQKSLLFPHMNVYDNLAFGLKIKKTDKQSIREKISEILADLGLEGFEAKFPHQLSGGESQRVSLARTLILEPKILLMDEPFSALDVAIRQDMQRLLKRIHKEKGITIVFVTHDLDEAFSLSDRIGVMSGGRLLLKGTPQDIYKDPKYLGLCSFVGIDNVLKYDNLNKIINKEDMDVINNSIKTEDGLLSDNKAENLYIGLRAKDLYIKNNGFIKSCTYKDYIFKGDKYRLSFEKLGYILYVDVEKLPMELIDGIKYDIDFNISDIKIIKE